MRTTALRTSVALVAAATLLAGCASSSGTAGTAETTPSPSLTADGGTSGMVDVISQTNILLVSAQETLEARDLVVEVVDVTGQGRMVEDPTQWVVVAQDPETGTVASGSTVVLEVRRTDDPRS